MGARLCARCAQWPPHSKPLVLLAFSNTSCKGEPRMAVLLTTQSAMSPACALACLQDVVKELPLPNFKVDLAFLGALLAPRHKLRPRRKAIKFLQVR